MIFHPETMRLLIRERQSEIDHDIKMSLDRRPPRKDVDLSWWQRLNAVASQLVALAHTSIGGGRSSGYPMTIHLTNGTDLILRDRKPVQLTGCCADIEVIAGKIWISSDRRDRLLSVGEHFRVKGPRSRVAAGNLGRGPATIRMRNRCDEARTLSETTPGSKKTIG